MPLSSATEKRVKAWGRVLTKSDHDLSENMADELAKERRQLIQRWGQHPWYWLTAIDPTTTEIVTSGQVDYYPGGRPLILTTDERDDEKPIKHYPNKEYLAHFVDLLVSPAPERRIVLVDKSRQMLFTTTCALVMDWFCRFYQSRRCLLSKTKLDDSVEVARDKIRAPHRRLPDWVKQWSPLPEKPAETLRYTRTSSYIRCVTQNVAEAEGRGGTPSIILIDEAARQFMFKQIMAAVLPSAGRVWAITTPEAGTPGSMAFYSFFEEKSEVVRKD